jgi:hypothetical protein
VAGAAQAVSDVFTAVWPTIEDTVLPLMTTLLTSIGPLVTLLVESLGPILQTVFDLFTVVWAAIGPALGPIIEAICAVIKPLADMLYSLVNAIKWIIDHLSGVAYLNPALTNPDLGAGGEAGANALVDLYKATPHAWGGFSSKPAIFGESGLEVAIPLTRGRGRAQQLVNQAGLAPDMTPLLDEIRALRREFARQNDRYVQLKVSGAVA